MKMIGKRIWPRGIRRFASGKPTPCKITVMQLLLKRTLDFCPAEERVLSRLLLGKRIWKASIAFLE